MTTPLPFSLFIISYPIRQVRAADLSPCHCCPPKGHCPRFASILLQITLATTHLSISLLVMASHYIWEIVVLPQRLQLLEQAKLRPTLVVMRALTAIGSCALNDLESRSGRTHVMMGPRPATLTWVRKLAHRAVHDVHIIGWLVPSRHARGFMPKQPDKLGHPS
jgi:hypothetical protein